MKLNNETTHEEFLEAVGISKERDEEIREEVLAFLIDAQQNKDGAYQLSDFIRHCAYKIEFRSDLEKVYVGYQVARISVKAEEL